MGCCFIQHHVHQDSCFSTLYTVMMFNCTAHHGDIPHTWWRCGEPPDLRILIPTFWAPLYLLHNTLSTMQRVIPQRARQLWGHAPRVRSFNRRRRNFATVSGTSQYDILAHSLYSCASLTTSQTLRCHRHRRWPRRLRSLCSGSTIRRANGPHNPKAREPRCMLM